MTEAIGNNDNRRRAMVIVTIYPIVIAIICTAMNLFVFGVNAYAPSVPSIETAGALITAAAILVVNHGWLMTTTELTRVRYKMYATPEEWVASGMKPDEAAPQGLQELKRRHDTHLNTTENMVYFALLSIPFVFAAPPVIAAQCWLIGFAIARVGYTWSFLAGHDNARGMFMTLGLLAMFGMTGYLAISLLV